MGRRVGLMDSVGGDGGARIYCVRFGGRSAKRVDGRQMRSLVEMVGRLLGDRRSSR